MNDTAFFFFRRFRRGNLDFFINLHRIEIDYFRISEMQSERDGEFGFARSRRSGDGVNRFLKFFNHKGHRVTQREIILERFASVRTGSGSDLLNFQYEPVATARGSDPYIKSLTALKTEAVRTVESQ